MRQYKIDVPFSIGDFEGNVTATYTWSPRQPAVLYGDHSMPEVPPDAEILHMVCKERPEFECPQWYAPACREWALDHHEPDDGPDPDDWRDRKRDEALMEMV